MIIVVPYKVLDTLPPAEKLIENFESMGVDAEIEFNDKIHVAIITLQ